MDNKKGVSKKFKYGILIASVVFIIFIIVVVMLFFNSPKKVENINVNAGNVSMTYTDTTNEFTITNALPTTDLAGKTLDGADQYFDFTVNTDINDANKVIYEISIEKNLKVSNILNNNVKIYLEKQNKGSYNACLNPTIFEPLTKKSTIGTPKGDMVIAKITKEDGDETADNYRLRMWMVDTAVTTEGAINTFSVKINVNAEAK